MFSLFSSGYQIGLCIIMIMLICILAMRVRDGLREWKKNNAAAIQQDTAVILVKELTRAPESPMARQESRVQLPRAAATCTVSFATEGHGILTLDLTKAEAHPLHENERGLVRWQGSRFLSWQKQ
jgi:hypothetical protein